jgi:hypothetical protein
MQAVTMSDDTPFKPKWTRRQVANHLFAFYSDMMGCFKNWALYLFEPDFDSEPELRNKANAIWISSLIDTLEGEKRILDDLEKHAHHYENQAHIACCEFIRRICRAVEEILALYSKEEQLFLDDFRDQLVHSWRWKFWIRYFERRAVAQDKVTFTDYHAIVRPFYERGVDTSLAACRRINREPPSRLLGAYNESLHHTI